MRRISTFLAIVAVGLLAWSTPASAADKLILVEEWNSATCPPCVPATEILNDVVDYREGVVSIRMHMWWPRPNDPWQDRDAARGDMGRTRIAYYNTSGQYSIPYGWIEGTRNPAMTNRDAVTNDLEAAKTQTSQVIMSVEEDRSDMNNIKVSVTVEGESGSNIGNAKLHVAVVARKVLLPNLPTTLPSHNGEILHTDVGLDMLPSPAGTDITIAAGESQTYDFNYSLTYDELAPEDEIYIIAFVQNDFNRQVYQTATNINGHELNAEWVGNPMVRLSDDQKTAVRTINVSNDDDEAVMAEVTSMTLPDGVTVEFSPSTFTMEVGETQEVQATYTYTSDAVFMEESLIQVRAVLPDGYAAGEVADLEILEPTIFAGTPEIILWTGLNGFAESVYRTVTLERMPGYAGKSVAVPGTPENMAAIGDDIETHILPMRFDPQVITGEQNVLTGYVLVNVQRWLTQGKRLAVFSNYSAGAALNTPTPEGLEATQQFFANILGVNFKSLPIQRYQLQDGGGAQITPFAITGVTNDPIGNGININPANQYSQQNWPTFDAFTDQMTIGNGPAEAVFYTDNQSANIAAVRAQIGEARLYYGGFGLEALGVQVNRNNVMTRILEWLEGDAPQGAVIGGATELDFGTTPTNKPATVGYTITNTGSETLTITELSIEGDAAFTLENVTLPLNIEAGMQASIDVTFAPAEETEYLAFMVIASNATNEESRFIDLVGVGGPVVSSVASNESQTEDMTIRTVQNPFVGSTMVEYALTTQTAKNVNISVHNVAGQEVAQLVNGVVTPGSYTTRFDGTQLPGGTYFIIMKSGEQSITVPAVNVK